MRRALAAVLACALSLPSAAAALRYSAAELQPDGRLRLTTTTGGVAWAPRDRMREARPQAAFDEPRIAPDGRTVGWLALYPGCCQSYPIPLALVLYRDGRILHALTGAGLPVWHWRFVGEGQVAFVQRPGHGAAPDHYELREIVSGRLVAGFDHAEGGPAPLPAWARGLAPRGEDGG